MKSGFFYISFAKFRNSKNGETAPFLLILLVILLIAAFAIVNIGKVGLHRVRTANAADSAAIAAASALASIANNIGEANQQMDLLLETFKGVIYATSFIPCRPSSGSPLCNANTPTPCPIFFKDLVAYKYYIGSLFINYLFLMYSTEKGFHAAMAQGHKTAFSNAGIQEAQIRDRDTKEIKPSRLSRWLNKQAVDDPPLPKVDFTGTSYTFKWFGYAIDPITGKEARESEPNEVTSGINSLDCAFVLDPDDITTVTKVYKFYVTAIHDKPGKKGCEEPKFCKCDKDRACLGKDKIAYAKFPPQVMAEGRKAAAWFALVMAGYGFTSSCSYDTEGSIIAALIALFQTPVIIGVPVTPPKKQCIDACPACGGPIVPAPKPATYLVTFFIPVPRIADIVNDENVTVTSTVTFQEPQREITGILRRKKTRITSSGTARMIPGDIDDPGSYDAELVGAQ